MFDLPSFNEVETAAPFFRGGNDGDTPLIQAALAGQMLHVG